MKKLYFFDESERERILNLHESATKNQYLINEQATDADKWKSYPCVAKHPRAVKQTSNDGSTLYRIDKEVYYNNGRKIDAQNKMANYTCNDAIFKPKAPAQPKNLKHIQDIQTKLKEVDPNFAATNKMDQATINKIMELLISKGAPKPAATAATTSTETQAAPATASSQSSQGVE